MQSRLHFSCPGVYTYWLGERDWRQHTHDVWMCAKRIKRYGTFPSRCRHGNLTIFICRGSEQREMGYISSHTEWNRIDTEKKRKTKSPQPKLTRPYLHKFVIFIFLNVFFYLILVLLCAVIGRCTDEPRYEREWRLVRKAGGCSPQQITRYVQTEIGQWWGPLSGGRRTGTGPTRSASGHVDDVDSAPTGSSRCKGRQRWLHSIGCKELLKW